jgi:hypothetical protein
VGYITNTAWRESPHDSNYFRKLPNPFFAEVRAPAFNP